MTSVSHQLQSAIRIHQIVGQVVSFRLSFVVCGFVFGYSQPLFEVKWSERTPHSDASQM